MTLVELLSTLRTRDINLWVEGERLRYSAPSGALTPDIREELVKHKADLLAFLSATDRTRRLSAAPIRRVSRDAKLLPSINQRRLWFIDQLQPNTAFNCCRADRVKGPLDIKSLERSLNEIVRRHEVLRTTFPTVDGEPLQVIHPAGELRLAHIDLRGIADAGERETEAERIITNEVEKPFDLAKGPLFRAHLLWLGTDEHLLLLNIHHIVTDGWSTGLLVKELTVLYESFIRGTPSPLPELPIQYADFAHWQSQWMQGEVHQQALSYWKERLKGAPEVTELLTDYPRPAVQHFQGSSEPVVISKSLTDALKTLSKKHGVTLFMTLLAAFKTLLYRYSGQEDLVLGSPIAGRVRSDTENLIGLFINTLVLRTDLAGNPTFRELLGRIREVALDAYAHQEVPFEKLMEELRLERGLTFTPLFQVMFVLQNTPEFDLKLLGSAVTPVAIKRQTALFDLFLSLAEKEEGLRGTLSYKTDLFDRVTISEMVERFKVLLRGIVADPDRPISTLPLLRDTEKHQLLVEWNDTQKDYPEAGCFPELFEAQVERTPDAVAVSCRDQHLTYRELNRRANQLAHYFRNLGVGPDRLVGICMERSLEMVVGLLGILKAGGAYVPLEPNQPAERLTWMLGDAGAPVLLTQQRFAESFSKQAVKVICLDSDWETISQQNEAKPVLSMDPDHLAYVIYTSGSTGRPKGVEVTHRAFLNFTTWACAAFEVEPSDRVLQFASIAFDTAVEEIFPCLIRGATLVLRTDSILESASVFLRQCRDWGITVLDLPTAYWHELTERLFSERLTLPDALRLVIIGGEKASLERLTQWRNTVGNRVRLLNTYGPTEATVVATMWNATVTGQAAESLGEVPIGRPIANVRTYVLDRWSNPVPLGVPGELHIGGLNLARGYLNLSDLTAENFIPDPFGKEFGGRLYKTGDLVRYRADGNIEFLGRVDNQVKVRGFRIELGEIESSLSKHSGVQQAVVVVCEEEPEDRRLTAYVVPRQEGSVTAENLRDFLQQALPNYMVPSAFVFLDSLPVTPSGKVDRKALPLPDGSRPELTTTFVAPRNATEEMMAGIWAEVLNLDRVGVRDNFFDIGGHSLLAVRLFAEIEKVFKIRPPLSGLFQEPTIEHLATLICQDNPTTTQSSLVSIQPHGSRLPLFCVHNFFGDIFCYMNLARYLGPEQPFYAIEARGFNGIEEPFDDIKTMATYYIEQIQAVQPQGPYALGGLCSAGIVAFEMAQQLYAKGEMVAVVALLDSHLRPGNNGTRTTRWTTLCNLLLDLPAWLTGSLELNRTQWADLVNLKRRMSRVRRAASSESETNPQSEAERLIREMGDFFQFSEQHYKVARSHYRAVRAYMPQIYPGRLTLFKARMQPLFSTHRPDNGWNAVAGGGLEIRTIPGNQLAMLKEPHVRVLAKELRTCLDRALTKVSTQD